MLRPALVPIITVTGLALGSLLSGTVLVENIFSWPGMGQYAYKSSLALDLPAVMGVSIVIAVIYVVINLHRRHPLQRHRSADPAGLT